MTGVSILHASAAFRVRDCRHLPKATGGLPTCARSPPSLMMTPCGEMTARREPSSDHVRLLAGKLRLNIPFQSAEMTAKKSAGVGKQQIAERIWNGKTACLVSPFRGWVLPGVSLV